MRCTVPTIRKLVVKETGQPLLTMYLQAEHEIVFRNGYLDRLLEARNVDANDVEWRDEPL